MRFWLPCVLAALAACAQASSGIETQRPGVDDRDEVGVDPYGEPTPEFVPNSEIDAGELDVPERPKPKPDGSALEPDGGTPTERDAAPPPACDDLAAGSLVIVEILVKSIDGAGDKAEWVELENPRECVLQVPAGLRVLSPRGTLVDVATVTTAFALPPHAHVLAGGPDAPGHDAWPTFRWTASDALKNSGDVIRVELGETAAPLVVDSVLYPQFNGLTAGRSVAFPSDCPAEARADFSNWSGSFAQSGALTATPFAPNDDVTCPTP